jgi:uncharacterized phage protein gp47/JayE
MTKIKTTRNEATGGASAVVEPVPATAADAPVAVFNGKGWQTPDGLQFNTRLKAERHMFVKLYNS